jgi:cytochrome b561
MTQSAMDRYPLVLRLLHWLMAICILGLIGLGIYMTPFESRSVAESDRLYYWHKSFGILVLLLLPLRLILRHSLRARLPQLPVGLPATERALAKGAKLALYVLMLAVPFIGWLHSSAYPFSSGVHFFVVDMPDLVAKSASLAATTVKIHRTLAYILLGVVVLHIAGAIKHRLFDRQNDVLPRMY